MRDPSLLVTRPTAGDPALAPARPRSALRSGARAESVAGQRRLGRRRRLLHRQHDRRRHRLGSRNSATMPSCCTSSTPRTGRRQGMAAGTPFALAHTFAQTGPFRPANTVRGIDNVGAGRIVDRAGRRRADRPAVRDGWPPTGSPGPRPDASRRTSEAGDHDPLRTRRRRCARSGPARRLRTVPDAQRRSTAARSSSPPGCSRPSSGLRCTRSTDSPAAPTTFSTTSTPRCSTAERAERLQRLATQLFNQLVQDQDCGDDPALRAVVHTARRYGIPWEMFDDFLTSMRMDLTVTDYPDRTALERYMHGSAEVIGLQMLPVLGTVGAREEAAPYAAALGKAFQLTNFLRDVDEDLRRGRVYLPADELAAHRVDRDILTWCQTNKRTDARVRRALAEQHAATRRVYEFARKGIELLDPRSRPCVAAAFTLYSEILDRIENIDYAIFSQRATVGTGTPTAGGRRRPGAGLARTVDARYEDLNAGQPPCPRRRPRLFDPRLARASRCCAADSRAAALRAQRGLSHVFAVGGAWRNWRFRHQPRPGGPSPARHLADTPGRCRCASGHRHRPWATPLCRTGPWL